MNSKLLAAAGIAAFLFYAPVATAAQCCGDGHQAKHDCCADQKGACCDMPCCADHKMASTEPSAVEILFAMNAPVADPQLTPAGPVRQLTEVWFHRPTRVGKAILQGRYVIEHDNDRMARGEPCTHIYAYSDQKTPVVAFHCTHLDRGRAEKNVAIYYTDMDGIARLTEFQFAGELAAHGVPSNVR